MGLTPDTFHELVREIARINGLPLDLAGDIAAELGDHALLNDDERTVTLTLFGESQPRTVLWPVHL